MIMIPVLLSEITTTNNGIGLLTDMTSCTVTEELNGMWELEFDYPTTGIHYEDIKVGRLIRTLAEEGATIPEFFRIYRVSTPMTGAVTVYAQHITYQLNYVPVMPIDEEFRTPAQALALMCQRAVGTSPYNSQYLRHIVASPCTFDFYADDLPLDTKKFGLKKPESLRSVIGGKEGGFLETYGGEIKWVGQSSACEVRIMASRGSDNGLIIEYGKNMTSLLNEQTSIGAITGICPYASYMETVELTPDEGGSGDITPGEDIGVTETVVTLPEKVIESSYASAWPFKRTACLDMSDRFTDTRYGIDPADLRAAAQKFVDDNALGVPRVSLEVGYLSIKNDLLSSQADSANTVHLGDTVTIRFRELGIETKEKVVKTVYNVLQDRWESVTIGTQMDNLAETLSSLQIGTDVIN